MPNAFSRGRGHGRALRHVLVATALSSPLLAHSARPLVTEDAGVLDPRACELEAWGGRQREDVDVDTLGAQAGCGVGANTQLTVAFTRDRETGEPATRALGLSAKTALGATHDGRLAWALALAVGGERVIDRDASDLTSTVVLAVTGRATEAITWHANLGWMNHRPARVTTTTWNLAGELAVRDGLDVTAELYGDDRQRPWAAAGLRLTPTEAWSFNAAVAAQSGAPHARQWTVGAKLAF